MTYSFWRKWLVTVSVVSIGFSLLLPIAAGQAWNAWLDHALLQTFFGDGPVPTGAASLWRFMCGVTGGIMLAWSVLTLGLAIGPLARQERWAWTCFVAGLSSWYVVDSSASAAAGVWFNVAGNTIYALLFGIPLAMMAPTILRGAALPIAASGNN